MSGDGDFGSFRKNEIAVTKVNLAFIFSGAGVASYPSLVLACRRPCHLIAYSPSLLNFSFCS